MPPGANACTSRVPAAPRGGPARRRRGSLRTGIAAALVGVGAALFPIGPPAVASGLLAQIETEIQKLAADLSRSVVTVRAVRVSPGQGEITEVYIGTGVVFDSGWVMSTPSVVAQGVRYSVQAPGDVPVPAELIGFDADAQTAVFRTPSLPLRPACPSCSWPRPTGPTTTNCSGATSSTAPASTPRSGSTAASAPERAG